MIKHNETEQAEKTERAGLAERAEQAERAVTELPKAELLVSRGKPAVAEHELPGCEAGKAVDGLETTCWAGAPYYKWWQLDLETPVLLEALRIETEATDDGGGAAADAHAAADGYTKYYIEGSSDKLNWTLVAEKEDERPAAAGGERCDLAGQGLVVRYLRVTITYCSTGEAARIRHFEVYGQAVEEADFPASRLQTAAPHLFYAVPACDEAAGFEVIEGPDMEPGDTEPVLMATVPGSYLCFRGVDFTAEGVNQLRGQFGFTDLDKDKRITLEVRVGRPDGALIGSLVLFKQWKRWAILAGPLLHEERTLLTGVHDVYLVLAAATPGQGLMVHWLGFTRKTPLPAPRPCPPVLPMPEGNAYRIYFGNLHSHTGFSDGIGVPEEAYDYARYTADLDFLAITEHSNLYDHCLDWSKSRKWADIQKTAERKTEDGAFLALYGAETTWYNQFGHMNTYNMDCFINAYEIEYNEIPHYYETLKRYPDSIQQWNHPWSCGRRHLDGFEPYDAQLDEVMKLIEINPIESRELGGLYYYVKALDLGWHVSPVGSQDNHHGQWGTQNNLRTGVLVEELTRTHFFDALRQHRTYFTSALYLNVWFQINGSIMGSRIARTDEVQVEVKAKYSKHTGKRMVKAEIIGEGGRVVRTLEQEGDTLYWHVALPGAARYYFVKIYQEDGEFAATAPIWLED